MHKKRKRHICDERIPLSAQNATKKHKDDKLRSTNDIRHQFGFPWFPRKDEPIFIETFKKAK